MNSRKMPATDPEVAATLRALRRASKRALRLSEAARTPFWVMKNGRRVNLNLDAKGRRKVQPLTAETGTGSKKPPENTGRAGKAED